MKFLLAVHFTSGRQGDRHAPRRGAKAGDRRIRGDPPVSGRARRQSAPGRGHGGDGARGRGARRAGAGHQGSRRRDGKRAGRILRLLQHAGPDAAIAFAARIPVPGSAGPSRYARCWSARPWTGFPVPSRRFLAGQPCCPPQRRGRERSGHPWVRSLRSDQGGARQHGQAAQHVEIAFEQPARVGQMSPGSVAMRPENRPGPLGVYPGEGRPGLEGSASCAGAARERILE